MYLVEILKNIQTFLKMIKSIFVLMVFFLINCFELNAQVTGENVSKIVYKSEQKVTLKRIKEKKWAIYLGEVELKDGFEYGFMEEVAFDDESITLENSERSVRYNYNFNTIKVYISELDFSTNKFKDPKLAPDYTILSTLNSEEDK